MNQLNQLLQKLQLSEERGVILLSKIDSWFDLEEEEFSFEIRERLHKINPSAVYHFNNQPFILFFDKSDNINGVTKEDSQIFEEVWSWDFVPVVFIIYPDGDKVFNAFNYEKKIKSLEELTFKKENKYEVFSFWELQSGGTWKWLEENFYKEGNRNILHKKRVNYRLFDNIRDARETLEKDFPYPDFINLLILRLIFIRYLIDREVEMEERFISGASVDKRRDCLNQLIGNKPKLIAFFNHLKTRFNGNLFETEKDLDIPIKSLNDLKSFFSDDFSENSNQGSLFYFDVFDFSIIPVEVISGIYESVIDEEKRKEESAVYTPLFLADYILKNTVDMHLENPKNPLCKVLDPSCGSGIFLTQTYRRLIEKEKRHGNFSDKRLIEIAEQNIFGIDRDKNALNVAAFSIYISILDYKDPKEIKTFHLPKLIGKNLFRNDFFNANDEIIEINGEIAHPFNHFMKEKELDFIIGNPPWGRKNDKKTDKFHLEYAEKMGNLLSNFETSQSFLIRAKDFSSIHTKCSLIISSRAFYNSGAKDFKEYFFKNFLVNTIFDLSAARRMIFQAADAPCIIVVYQYAFFEQTNNHTVQHLSIKPNRFLKNYKILVVDNEDIKQFKQNNFLKYDWFFKVALYGNWFDLIFLNRLESLKQNKSLIDIIDNKEITFKGKGILKGTPKRCFTFLEGLPKIEAKQIQLFYSQIPKNSQLLKKEDTYLESGRRLELFSGNQILLKKRTKNGSSLVISYSENGYVFGDSVYAITSKSERKKLARIYALLISNFSTYFQFLISSYWGVSTRPEITLEEYLVTPFIEIEDHYFLTNIESFIETYKTYYSSILKSPSPPNPNNLKSFQTINKIINEAYQISPIEEDLIDYVLNVSRYQFQESKLQKFLRKPTTEELERYAQVFYDYFGTVYNEKGEYFQIEIHQSASMKFTTMKFNIVSMMPSKNNRITFVKVEKEEDFFEKLASNLSIYQLSSDIFIQKNVKGYEEDFFYIIKPNEYKCWHRAIAHHDLETFKSEMMQAEMELMNETYD